MTSGKGNTLLHPALGLHVEEGKHTTPATLAIVFQRARKGLRSTYEGHRTQVQGHQNTETYL